jgi:hypothetical protein
MGDLVGGIVSNSLVKNTLYEHYGTINITGSTIDNYFLRRKQVRN